MASLRTSSQRDLVVIGGGISGLAAAYEAHARGLNVLLVEAGATLGGNIQTEDVDGYRVEWGPNTVRSGKGGADAIELADACGLESERILADRTAHRRYILHPETHKLCAVSPGPGILLSPLLSMRGKLALAEEFFNPPREAPLRYDDDGHLLAPEPDWRDETIAQFVTRRISREFADHIIAPLVSGIYAGDIDRLSMPAVFPSMAALEANYGGLFRGALGMALARIGDRLRRLIPRVLRGGQAGTGDDDTKRKRIRATLYSYRDGFAGLIAGIARTVGPSRLHKEMRALAVEYDPVLTFDAKDDEKREKGTPKNSQRGGYRVTVLWERSQGTETIPTRAVAIATRAGEAADLLDTLDPDALAQACRQLRAIPYAPMAVVAIGLRREHVGRPLDGFGFLIPRVAGVQTLGCLWSSALFSGRTPDGRVLLTNFVGGSTNPDIVDRDEGHLIDGVMQDLHGPMQLTLDRGAAPAFAAVRRHEQAIPQYTLGHLQRISDIDRALARSPHRDRVILIGNYVAGISLNDSVRHARERVRPLLDALASDRVPPPPQPDVVAKKPEAESKPAEPETRPAEPEPAKLERPDEAEKKQAQPEKPAPGKREPATVESAKAKPKRERKQECQRDEQRDQKQVGDRQQRRDRDDKREREPGRKPKSREDHERRRDRDDKGGRDRDRDREQARKKDRDRWDSRDGDRRDGGDGDRSQRRDRDRDRDTDDKRNHGRAEKRDGDRRDGRDGDRSQRRDRDRDRNSDDKRNRSHDRDRDKSDTAGSDDASQHKRRRKNRKRKKARPAE